MYRAPVLVIDDDELVCDVLKTSLTDAGFVVDAVLEPATALLKFKERQYDAVIVDVILPEISGTELLEKFHEINPETSVILVTAHPEVETAQKAVQFSAFDYIRKPFEIKDMISRTRNAAERTKRLREKRENERSLKAKLTENLKEIEFRSDALKAEQERFYGIFKSANFGLMVLNGLDERIILINDQCKNLLKMTRLSDERCFDQEYHHLVPPQISHEIDYMVRDLRSGTPVSKVEPVTLSKDRILELQSYPVKSDDVMLAIVVMINDITERKHLEKQLLMTSKLAGIGELAAGIAHEINNPIGFVKSNMNTLNEYVEELTHLVDMYHDLRASVENGASAEDITKKIREYEENIDSNFILRDIEKIVSENRDGLDRVARIVRDLRTFTRFDDEKKTAVDINKAIEDALNITRNEVKYKAEVSKELEELPETKGFGGQLGQVFVNLIVNAAQSIEKKGVITIRSFFDGKNIIVEIQDTGKGIPEEMLEQIFDPFFTTKSSGEGTGLGLSIVHEIVSKHKGKITVKSEIGKGSVFRIELPVQTKPEEAARK